MIDALWSFEFSSNAGALGAGVAVIETGRFLGGDSSFMYVGNVRVDNGFVLADLTISKYSNTGGLESIFGPATTFHIKASAPIDAQRMVFRGHLVENPALQITAVAVRRAEVP